MKRLPVVGVVSVALTVALVGCSSSGSGPEMPPPGMTGSGSGSDMPGPLDPPSGVHVEASTVSHHCVLTWTPPAQPVDGYRISANVLNWAFADEDTHGGIAPGIATQAELEFSQSPVHELSKVDIRIQSRHHSQFSSASPPVTCVLPVTAPQDVAPVIQPGGIAVTWMAFSAIASSIQLESTTLDATGMPGTWSVIAALPPRPQNAISQTQVDTSAVVLGTVYAYRVSAVAPTGERGTSPVAASPAIGAPLASSTVALPPASATVADGQGHFAMFSVTSTPAALHFIWGDGTTFHSSPAIAAMAFAPFVRLDAAGLPHTVYGKPGAPGTGLVITHGWSDGTQWLEETIAQRGVIPNSTTTPALAFDLDATGTPVAMWSLGNDKFEAAVKVAGSWTFQPLDALIAFIPLGPFSVFVDRSGATHLLVSTNDFVRHIQFAGGAWTAEPVPGTFGAIAGPLLGAGHDPQRLAICFNAIGFYGMPQPRCVRKTAAGWGKVEPLGVLPGLNVGLGLPASIAMSPDGGRLAALYQLGGTQLFRSDGVGVWSELALPALAAQGQREPTPFLGFDPSGKLFLLVDPTQATDQAQSSVPYQLRSEP